MANVDDRVVQMTFDNKNFENNVSTTMSTLDKLKKALDFSSSKKGMDELQNSANHFNMGPVSASIEGVSTKLLAWGTLGVTALANIANRAVDTGIAVAKSLTVDPVKAGLQNYETQINAVQTILANTASKGTSLDQVNAALKTLNDYANLTVFNFSEMARNIGTFTAAGVDLQTSTNAIKGIANLAALSGSNSEQASTAMYQLSQAIASGKVQLQDWNSVVNAGIGGKTFQEALFNTAKQMGTIKDVPLTQTFDQWTAAGNSFRGSLQDGWITSQVLTSTLSQFTGDLTDAQLKSQGYNDTQIKQIQTLAKNASKAATNIKTLTQLQQALKEEVASAWANVFKTIFGDINQATELFTNVHNVLQNAFTGPIIALNTLLEGWAQLGGRAKLIEALTNVFHDLSAVLKPIGEAWRELFPKKTAQDLFNLTVGFSNLVKNLTPGADTIDRIKRSFAGLFAVIDIARQIGTGIINVLREVFNQFAGGPTAILKTTATIGDFLVNLDKTIKRGGYLVDFFQDVAKVLTAPIELIKGFAKAIGNLFDGFDKSDFNVVGDSFGRVSDRLSTFSPILEAFSTLWKDFGKVLKAAGDVVKPVVDGIVNAFGDLGDAIAAAMASGNFDAVLDIINTGLLGGILLLVKKFFKGGIGIDIGHGFLGNISESFETLTGTLKAMQTSIKADTLLKIAAAVGLLTISIVALSLIDSAKLTKAMTGIGIAFGELLAAMAILTKISGAAGFVKVPIIAASMVLLAGALDLLTIAIVVLSRLSWEELGKGLAGVAGAMAILAAATVPLSANSAGMIRAGIGITALAIALNILALAVKQFAAMDWAEMGKGLAGVAGALLVVAGAMTLMPANMLITGAGLVAVGVGLTILAGAILLFGQMDLLTMGKGLLGVAGALLVIGGAMTLMPPTLPITAIGLIAVGAALLIIASALKIFAAMSWEEIGKGLATLAGSLVILAGGLYLMSGTLPGAAALLVAAAALAILTPVLVTLGKLSWTEIAKGLAAIAGALAVIGIAGLLIAPVVPILIGLGAAILLLGGGFALLGLGAFALATAFSLLASVGTAGVAVLLDALEGFIKTIPELASSLADALIAIVVQLGNAAPKFVDAFAKLLDALLDAVIKEVPKIAQAIGVLIQNILLVIRNAAPALVQTGIELIEDLLTGVKNNIGQIATTGQQIVINLLEAIAAKVPDIIAAGVDIIVSVLQGISDNIGRVIDAGAQIPVQIIEGISREIDSIIQAGTDLIVNYLQGIANAIPQIAQAGTNIIVAFIKALGDRSQDIINAAFLALLTFLNGLAKAINTYAPQLRQAGINIAFAIADGMTFGLASKAKNVASSAVDVAKGAVGAVTGFLHINSPSKVFIKIGSSIGEGMVVGIDGMARDVANSATDMASGSLDAMANGLKQIPSMLDGIVNLDPVIAPVLDLSNVQKDASQIDGMLNVTPITAAASYGKARSISADQQAAQDQAVTQGASAAAAEINFTQINQSPKALDPVAIYRNTKNQLSMAKEALSQ